MGLILGTDFDVFPSGEHRDEMELLVASLQNWSGKQDANGRWITMTFNASDFIVRGAGNSWVVPNNTYNRISYYLLNNVMVLNVYVINSTLTITPTPDNTVSVRLPDGYRVAGAFTSGVITEGRIYAATIAAVVASTAETVTALADPSHATEVRIQRYAGNYADGLFGLQGQVAIEVTKG